MNRFNQSLGLLALSTLLVAGSAQAAPRFSVFGVGDLGKMKSDPAIDVLEQKAKFGFGGGAQVELPLSPMLGLEIGAIYLSRKSEFTNQLTGVSFTGTYIQVPVQLRVWLNKFLSVGAGGYFASAMGDIK